MRVVVPTDRLNEEMAGPNVVVGAMLKVQRFLLSGLMPLPD